MVNSAVVGTFTPHQKDKETRKRRPLDPINNYFPAVVERELFERVASRVKAPAARGRNATTEPASIFAGVLRCTHCGGLVTRVSKGGASGGYITLCAQRRTGKAQRRVVTLRCPTGRVSAVRANAKTIIRDAPRGLETAELDEQIAKLDADTEAIEAQPMGLLMNSHETTVRQCGRD